MFDFLLGCLVGGLICLFFPTDIYRIASTIRARIRR